MSLAEQFRDLAAKTLSLVACGYWTPTAIRYQLNRDELDAKLRVACAEHYATALAWIEWRRARGTPRRPWLDAARDEYEHAIRYGPHITPPHPDKKAQEAP